ncbi:MAG: hypothetical protein OQK70_00590 [Gammaproteobacteria bacterium]|nr:hypothetical protein [Gammaproteobacteria bacterium]
MTENSLSKKQKIINLLIAAVIIVPIIMATYSIIQGKNLIIKQLIELTSQREKAFSEIRPVLIQYKEDHKLFPDTLNQLVPDYIDSIPPVLQSTSQLEYASKDMSLEYISDGESAAFHYRKGYDHTPVFIYDISSGISTETRNSTEDEKQSPLTMPNSE